MMLRVAKEVTMEDYGLLAVHGCTRLIIDRDDQEPSEREPVPAASEEIVFDDIVYRKRLGGLLRYYYRKSA